MRLGWGWKLFGVVIFQLGLSSLGVTYKSHQKGAVLVFFLKQQKKGRWDSQTDRLLQRVKEWATASVSEWVNGLLSEGQITCLLPDRGKLPRSALIAATRTSSLCRRCLHQPAGHSQALDYSPAWLHLWEDILSDTMLVFEVQKQQQMLFSLLFLDMALWGTLLKCYIKFEEIPLTSFQIWVCFAYKWVEENTRNHSTHFQVCKRVI